MTSVVVSLVKGNTMETNITQQHVLDSDIQLTTTGLNEIIVQKIKGAKGKKKKNIAQPKGCGFVANYGENKNIILLFHIDGIRNFRIKKQ